MTARHPMNPARVLSRPALAGQAATPAVETRHLHQASLRLRRVLRRASRAVDPRAAFDAVVLVVLFPAALGAMYASIAFTPGAYR